MPSILSSSLQLNLYLTVPLTRAPKIHVPIDKDGRLLGTRLLEDAQLLAQLLSRIEVMMRGIGHVSEILKPLMNVTSV